MNRSCLIGFLSFSRFIIQFISGLLCSLYYSDNYDIAYAAVIHIVMDVKIGLIIRLLHIIGASLFMLFSLLHFVRGYYRIISINSGYTGANYNTGLSILLLSLVNGSIGYISNWGQMSFWGMIVIIPIVHSIPLIGEYIGMIVWPAYILGISRLYTFHFVLALFIAATIAFHIFIIHAFSSSNPIPNPLSTTLTPFLLYTSIKDTIILAYSLILFSITLILNPDAVGNCDNNIAADPFTTPHNILPEWYSLLFYCCSRSYPNKNIGVVIVMLLILLYIQ